MHNRGTAQEANEHLEKAPGQSSKGDAVTQVTDSKDAGDGTTGKGNQADSETAKSSSGDDKVSADDEDEDGNDKKKKEVPIEDKVDMKKYAVHSDLKDELDKKMEGKPESEIGVINPAKMREMEETGETGGDDKPAGASTIALQRQGRMLTASMPQLPRKVETAQIRRLRKGQPTRRA
jgi:hypothetical protein